MIQIVAMVLLLLGTTAGDVYAIDHKNLDQGRPLRLEDAYPVADGEMTVEAGAGLTVQRRGPHRGFFPLELLYGALPNLQIAVGTLLSTDPHEIDDRPKSGDLRLSALYNFNQETITIPAFALELGMDAPTGVDAVGYGVEMKAIVTKSIERLSFHFNAGYEFFTDRRRDERDGRYELALGTSYPIGAPKFTRATLLADVFAEQSSHVRGSTTVGAELGLRYQLTPRIVWDAGVGTEFAGPVDRSMFFITTGVSVGF